MKPGKKEDLSSGQPCSCSALGRAPYCIRMLTKRPSMQRWRQWEMPPCGVRSDKRISLTGSKGGLWRVKRTMETKGEHRERERNKIIKAVPWLALSNIGLPGTMVDFARSQLPSLQEGRDDKPGRIQSLQIIASTAMPLNSVTEKQDGALALGDYYLKLRVQLKICRV